MAPTLADARSIIARTREAHPDLCADLGAVTVKWSPSMTVTAGKATYASNTIALSGPIFSDPANHHGFENTVLHELAHLIVGADGRGGDNLSLSAYGYGRRRTKANPHGPRWQRVHKAIGGTAERCHSLEVKRSPKRGGGDVICDRCCEITHVGPKVFATVQAGDPRTFYTHKRCGGRFTV